MNPSVKPFCIFSFEIVFKRTPNNKCAVKVKFLHYFWLDNSVPTFGNSKLMCVLLDLIISNEFVMIIHF